MTPKTILTITRSSGGGNGCLLNVEITGTVLTPKEINELIGKLLVAHSCKQVVP